MSNPRIKQITATVEAEVLAPRTVINWNPIGDTGSVTFECARYYREAGTNTYFGVPEPDGGMSVALEELLTKVITVQTPQGPMDVPALVIVGAVKALFEETHYAQRTPKPDEPPVESGANGAVP